MREHTRLDAACGHRPFLDPAVRPDGNFHRGPRGRNDLNVLRGKGEETRSTGGHPSSAPAR
eukprot:27677-Pyramimonas_sp.AAC.1